MAEPTTDVAKMLQERELLFELLELGVRDSVEGFLERALGLLIELVGARRGYIELRDPADDAEAASFSMLRGAAGQSSTTDEFSRSVVAETFATGEAVVTASAQTDPRFENSASVRSGHLEAVLCVPLGQAPVLGVVYLQDRTEAGPFSDHDRKRAELFARYLGHAAERLLWRSRQTAQEDPTRPWRQRLKLAGVVGTSPALAKVLQQVSVVAPLNIGVLLTGASGTGKTQLARAIHDNSPRAGGPFVEVNCAALPEDLLENELFGAAQGAHSTAHRRSGGKLTAAEGGSLFLDEVGELALHGQAKLLQVLQSGTYYPLGDATERQANVRVIAATNTDLGAAVAAKRFREDLFYRLSVFPIRMPSLAERPRDISALARHFCTVACESNNLPVMELSPGAILALEHNDWPGNIRELAHLLQAGVVRALGEGGLRVERRHLFVADGVSPDDASLGRATFDEATRAFQAQLLRETLAREGWNVAAAARSLDLTRTHVYNLMKTFRISRPGAGGDR